MSWSVIFEILNKLFPSRKGALVDQLNALTVKYQQALDEGRDTDAAILKKQLIQLRQKAGLTEGDI
jgi:hypothetical protein